MKTKNIIAYIVIAGFLGLLFMNFGSTVGGYMDFTEAATTGQSAHVVGHWKADMPTAYDKDTNTFRFHMADEQGAVREVHYLNPKPANFEDAEKLVIEGHIQDEVFIAEHILVKCPSKYNETSVIEPEATS